MARTKSTQREIGSPEELQGRLAVRFQWWASTAFGFLFAALTVRLGWELSRSTTLEAVITSLVSMLSVLGIGGLTIFFILRPRHLLSPLVVTIVFSAVGLGLIGGLIHYIRFVFISPVPLLAKVIATGLVLATVCGVFMVLYALRWVKVKREGSHRTIPSHRREPETDGVSETK